MQKSKLYGLIGSTLSSTILLLVLWFAVLSIPGSTENEGFLVSFGDSFDGGGSGYVPVPSRGSWNNVSTGAQTKTTKASTTTTTAPAASTPTKQTVFTQEDNSVALNQQKEKERAAKIQNEINTQRIETEKRKAEQSRKEQVAINKANAVNGLFGNNGSTGGSKGSGSGSGTGTGKGTGSGSGNGVQGNPAGKGATGVGYDLKLGNRNYLGRPAKPNYPKDVEGKITVNIRVNENGVVTSTSIGSPTTISDSEMRRDAMSAANKTRFTAGKNIETGSITYNYKLE